MHSIELLAQNDGDLFNLPIEENAYPDKSRKLHEVCINHKLAEYLAATVRPLLDEPQKIYVDIEFNREGINFKDVRIGREKHRVRPDIIIHNRKSNADKFNLLVVECKDSRADDDNIKWDVKKIKALMTAPRYEYHYGLQVIYDPDVIKGTLFYKQDASIIMEPIKYSRQAGQELP